VRSAARTASWSRISCDNTIQHPIGFVCKVATDALRISTKPETVDEFWKIKACSMEMRGKVKPLEKLIGFLPEHMTWGRQHAHRFGMNPRGMLCADFDDGPETAAAAPVYRLYLAETSYSSTAYSCNAGCWILQRHSLLVHHIDAPYQSACRVGGCSLIRLWARR
jgi:hypothetical protein